MCGASQTELMFIDYMMQGNRCVLQTVLTLMKGAKYFEQHNENISHYKSKPMC